MTGRAIADAIVTLQREVYRLTCEEGMEIHLPDAAFDQLSIYAADTYGVKITNEHDPQMLFQGIKVWRLSSYAIPEIN